jgi:predicted NAD/FAD-dependent oxidoreductase
MAGLAERLSAGLDVRLGAAVTGIAPGADGWRLAFADGAERIFGGLVLAVPAPQAAALLRPVGHGFVGRVEGVVMAPCWTLMLGFEGALPGPDVVRPEAGPVAWIARENSRPKAAAGPVGYTVQASPEWSRAHLEDAPEDVVAALTAAFVAASGVAVGPAHAVAHRWRYARAEVALGEDFLWDAALQVGVCGDWCLAGRLEAAYLSGNALGIRLAHEF